MIAYFDSKSFRGWSAAIEMNLRLETEHFWLLYSSKVRISDKMKIQYDNSDIYRSVPRLSSVLCFGSLLCSQNDQNFLSNPFFRIDIRCSKKHPIGLKKYQNDQR